jgi:A/G-specific adenine glycosylase
MLQQTQVDRVLPKYLEFLERFPDVRSLASVAVGDVIRAWSPLGYNMRAVRLHRAAQAVVEEHSGRFPVGLAEIRSLPGVGDYTAAAVACFALGRRVSVVDTNVRRVLGRALEGRDDVTPKAAWALAERALPQHRSYEWNQALMDLGAMVCVARGPRCGACPLEAYCLASPSISNGLPRAAEALSIHRSEAFKGSRRYYRGRIVERLRGLDDGAALSFPELASALGPEVEQPALPLLQELVAELDRDGLVRVAYGEEGGTRVSLP